MKGTLYALLIMVSAYALAQLVATDSGYILIAYDRYVMESTLWSLMLAIFVGLLALGLFAALFRVLFKGVDFVHPFSGKARRRRAEKMTTRGLVEYANGRWKSAQKLLAQSAENGQAPLLNYLAAARAANENGNYEACAEYLRLADKNAPSAKIAIGITQAELLLTRGQLESALATLQHLQSQASKHAYVHKLLYQTYLQLSDWKNLVRLLPQLKKLRVLENKELIMARTKIYQSLFRECYQTKTDGDNLESKLKDAEKFWQKLDRSQKLEEPLVVSYADCLLHLKAPEKAENIVRSALLHNYSKSLINLYSRINCKNTEKQLATADKFLSERPKDPDLLIALGRFNRRLNHDEKAEQFLSASLKQHKSERAYRELAILMAKRKQYTQCAELFINSVDLASEVI